MRLRGTKRHKDVEGRISLNRSTLLDIIVTIEGLEAQIRGQQQDHDRRMATLTAAMLRGMMGHNESEE